MPAAFASCRCLSLSPCHVSAPRSPNPSCGFPATGSPVGSCRSLTGRSDTHGDGAAADAARARSSGSRSFPRSLPFAFACGGSVALEHSSGVLGSATPGALRSFLHLSSPEAPSLLRRYPLSTVVRASPPPGPACPLRDSGLARARHRQGFPCCCCLPLAYMPPSIPRRNRPVLASLASRPLAAFPVFSAGRLPRCPFRGLLNVHCTLSPARSLNRPRRPFSIAVLQSVSLPPRTAPITSGWSDSCRAGFAPAEKQRLSTAHEKVGLAPAGTEGSAGSVTGAASKPQVGMHPDLARCVRAPGLLPSDG